jgi:hypothetical protein
MPAALDRDRELPLAREADSLDDISTVRRTNDERRTAVDHSVPDPARRVVLRIERKHNLARKHLSECGQFGGAHRSIVVGAIVLAVLAFAAAGCQNNEPEPAEPPAAVADTRSGILRAAESENYDQLRPLIDIDVFLSDYGFGGSQPDPVKRWRKLGPKPLQTMSVLLRMSYSVRETGEGTLYQWPRFGPDSVAEDMSDSERALLRTIMTDDEVRDLILPEYGYTTPRLGILADGTWWFFILEGGP